MLKVSGVDHLVLRVKDLPAMLAFYVDVLGCPIERRNDEIGLIQLRAGTSLIDLVPVDGRLGAAGGAAPGEEGRNLDHFCLRIEGFDLEAVRRHLEAHGVEMGEIGVRFGAGGEGLSVYLADPDGNGLELRG
ncbi:MAG: VOC family protein [Phenylobacterium sp.]|jgi:catechol 2,3-dioxygenase-like lactoylglutathione lyase family enzyme|uniref:VOC family protein n=1 Tax=Phenylobacterium sp. TaxID=1871053 RepID=UPI002A358C5F|nr:VOC family protein [Phenylobacterium sp.]MDX9998402.1 VOC family protein [Phenylobacterium sp.]